MQLGFVIKSEYNESTHLLLQFHAEFGSSKPAHAAQKMLQSPAIQIRPGLDTRPFVGPLDQANELQMRRKMAYSKANKLG